MNTSSKNNIGKIGWIDLTVPDADKISDFYSKVIGWKSEPVSLGEYNDYCVNPPSSDEPVAGICHARGENKDMPTQWLLYVTVEDLDKSISRCNEMGGKVIAGPRNQGKKARFCVIEDPAGAVVALYEEKG